MIFQRRQKALLWSKGLKVHSKLRSGARCLVLGMNLHLLLCVFRKA